MGKEGWGRDLLTQKIFAETRYQLRNEMDDCLESHGNMHWLACVNPHSFVTALNDEQFKASLNDATWLVPDGKGVVLGCRLLGNDVVQTLTGSDVFSDVCRIADTRKFSVFLLGAGKDTLNLMTERMCTEFPNIRSVHSYSPPYAPQFSEKENAKIVDLINKSGAEVLWVGMTAPKQEKWIYENRHRLTVRFAGAVGAVFDYYAGTIKRPSYFWRQLGLEWLIRFLKEPRRLWRRNMISSPKFVIYLLCLRLFRRHQS
jgi:N-acetylglucosaminyldiphosphoundecaprenol N-acetyl-beta-D-mannosaminyltransferase